MPKGQLPQGYQQQVLFGENIIDETNLNIAINMIDNAERGILIDVSGNIIRDLNADFALIDQQLEAVELKRINNAVSKNKNKFSDIRISVQDIKSVLFKPIIEMPLDNPNVIQGRSVFATWWKNPQGNLYDNLSAEVTLPELQRAFNFANARINSFDLDVLSWINDLAKFIDALLDEVPTAFGDMSP